MSEDVAEALERGDPCTAEQEAHELQAAAVAAINENRVPGPYQEELQASVNELVADVRCEPVTTQVAPPPAVVPPPPEEQELEPEEDAEEAGGPPYGKAKGKQTGKGKEKKDKKKDDE